MPPSSARRAPTGPRDAEPTPVDRFRETDAYRARREWLRYEGTAQRDLYRELRERFLARHAVTSGWAIDVGSGPGRFLSLVGGRGTRKVAIDLSRKMLELVPETWRHAGGSGTVPDRVRGDAAHPPFAAQAVNEVVVLGNTLGFAGRGADGLLEAACDLVAPGGTLLAEVAPAPGERSQYLGRLPPTVLVRLLHAPLRAVLARLDREPFREEPARHATPRAFRRIPVSVLLDRLRSLGWDVRETMAVAPALGPDAERIAAVRRDPTAWARLIALEEEVGRRADRWPGAAAVLVAAVRASSMRMIK